MTNFIFKSANRLIKNSPITLVTLMNNIRTVQRQNQLLRQDLVDVKRMIQKLMIDKHLQMQVDEYFTNDGSPQHPEDSRDID